jgi:hypothetical protein
MGTDIIGSCNSNYDTITTITIQVNLFFGVLFTQQNGKEMIDFLNWYINDNHKYGTRLSNKQTSLSWGHCNIQACLVTIIQTTSSNIFLNKFSWCPQLSEVCLFDSLVPYLWSSLIYQFRKSSWSWLYRGWNYNYLCYRCP